MSRYRATALQPGQQSKTLSQNIKINYNINKIIEALQALTRGTEATLQKLGAAQQGGEECPEA